MTPPILPVRSPRLAWSATLVVGLVLAVGIALLSASGARAADEAPQARAGTTALTRAQTALALALTELDQAHPAKAVAALKTYAQQSRRAHTAAIGLIGKPPTDPESDDPPGPPAILAMLRLDHQATMKLVPRLDRQTKAGVVTGLRRALKATHVQRNRMITQVTGLRPAAADDYVDGMSDVLGTFTKEIALIDTGLGGYQLTAVARTSLTETRERVVAADQMMNDAYGGGE